MSRLRGSLMSVETTDSTETTENELTALTDYALKWKTILLLQFQPQFELITYFGVYFTYICVIMDLTFAYSCNPQKIARVYDAIGLSYIYCFDMLYVLDILLMVFYRSTTWPEMQHMHSTRYRYMIALDVLSVVPFDAIYYSLADANMRLIYLLRLRYVLRTPRLFVKLVKICRIIWVNALIVGLLLMIIFFTVFSTTMACVFFYKECHSRVKLCKYKDYDTFSVVLLNTYFMVTSGGLHINIEESLELYTLYLLTILTIAFFSSLFLVGYIAAEIIQIFVQKQIFKNFRNLSIARLQRLGLRNHIVHNTVLEYFDIYGKNRNESNLHPTDINTIPTALVKTIYLDVSWEVFKHSHIFRGKDTTFLQCVASYIIHTHAIPGETIFSRGSLKDSMVYLASGVVQILSVEDGETPILSFSGGTVFSEISLFVCYPSACSVTCQTDCELRVLTKKAFHQVRKRYPNTCTGILLDIEKRIAEAYELKRLLKHTHNELLKDREHLVIQRLDNTLRRLCVGQGVTPHRSNTAEKYAEGFFEETLFCSKYLDLLVPAEPLSAVADTVFVKETIPCVIRPESFLISVWNTLVATTALIFIYIYPYYASFEPNTSIWFTVFLNIVSVIWMIDIFVSLSTAVKEKETMIIELPKIAAYRFKTISFWVDLWVAFPLLLLSKLLFVNLSRQGKVLMEALKLLKLYKILYLFRKWNITHPLITTYIKYFILATLHMYYCGAICYMGVCYNSVCKKSSVFYKYLLKYNATTAIDKLIILSYSNTEFAVGNEFGAKVEGDFTATYTPLLAACFTWTLLYVYFLAAAIATTTLEKYDKLRIQTFVRNVSDTIDSLKLDPKHCQKIFNFIQTQVDYNGGEKLLYPKNEVTRVNHPVLLAEACYAAYGNILRACPLFRMLSDELLTDISRRFSIQIFGPETVVTHAGEVCKQVHLIFKGHCRVIPFSDKSNAKTETSGYPFGFMEMYFGTPMINTVLALTHVEVLTASCKEYAQMLSLHPELQNETDSIVNEIKDAEALLVEAILSKLNSTNNTIEIEVSEKHSFKYFGYKLNLESKRGIDYHSPFDKLQCLSFLRFVIFRVTILPYGQFIYIYEGFRCIFAFLSVLLYPMNRYLTQYSGQRFWQPIFHLLYVIAWMDIGVRHYIAYFNKDGLEITHPLKTITHYWTHSFVTDLLGCLPLSSIVQSLFHIKYIPVHYDAIFVLLHCLRLYRIYNGIRHLDELRSVSSSQLWAVLKYVPLTLVVLVFVATTHIHSNCEFNLSATRTITETVQCVNNSWISQSTYTRPLDPTRVYLYGFLLAANIIIRPALQGFSVSLISSALKITILSMIAYSCFHYITANVTSKNILRNADICVYQEAMADLLKFLSYRFIDISVQREVIAHFEHIWRVRSKKNIKHIIKRFDLELQGDVLLDIYGQVAKNSSIFENASESFLRSLLVSMDHEIIIKRGIIYKVNDIQNKIYFLLKGYVEVAGADDNRLTILRRGSLFGNLNALEMKRQTLTMIAKGHVELLTIECIKFHSILSNYHDLKRDYYQKTAVNSDYIFGVGHSKLFDNVSLSTYSSFDTSQSEDHTEFIEDSTEKIKLDKIIEHLETFVAPAIGGFGFMLESYQIVMDEHCLAVVLILYLLDILSILNIFAKFYTPYENEFGILIRSRRNIALRYIKQPYGFFLHLASVIPFEVACLFFIGSNRMWSFWKHCRCNRLLRIVLLVQYFYYKNRRLNINVFMIRFFMLTTWNLLTLHLLTCGLIVLCCMTPDDVNMSPELSCKHHFGTSYNKLLVYLTHYSAICSIFVCISPRNYYPHSMPLIIYFVTLVFICRILTILYVSGMCTNLYIVFHNRINYAQEIHKLIKFLNKERVSRPLIKSCRCYVNLLWMKKSGHQFPMLLNEAPYYLREAVLNSMFGFHLRRHYLFRFCHTDLIRQIASKLQTRIFLPGNYLAMQKDMDECMYFIQTGQVNALTEDDSRQKVEHTFYSGDMFGFEQGLYLRCPHEFTYIAVVYSLVIILYRKDWFYMLEFFPASKEVLYSKRREMQILRKSR